MRRDRRICDDRLELRLPSALREQVEQEAFAEGHKPASLVRHILEERYADRQRGEAAA